MNVRDDLVALADRARDRGHDATADELRALATIRAIEAPAPEAVPVTYAVVPPGWALIPERVHLPAEAFAALTVTVGFDVSETGDTPWVDGTLWVGALKGDDGEDVHGLHLYCDECPEEGSVTLAEFAAPQPAQPERGEAQG